MNHKHNTLLHHVKSCKFIYLNSPVMQVSHWDAHDRICTNWYSYQMFVWQNSIFLFVFVLLLRSSSCTIRTKKRNLNSCFYSVRVEPCFYMSKILIFVQATTQLYTRVIFCWKKMYPSCELFCIYPSCVSHVWTVLCERSTGRV